MYLLFSKYLIVFRLVATLLFLISVKLLIVFLDQSRLCTQLLFNYMSLNHVTSLELGIQAMKR